MTRLYEVYKSKKCVCSIKFEPIAHCHHDVVLMGVAEHFLPLVGTGEFGDGESVVGLEDQSVQLVADTADDVCGTLTQMFLDVGIVAIKTTFRTYVDTEEETCENVEILHWVPSHLVELHCL